MSDRDAVFTSEAVISLLSGSARRIAVEVYGEVTSTNAIVRQRATDGEPEGLAVIAAFQTAGRGRKGRSFFSPEGTGLYMSLLLRPKMAADMAVRVTTVAAVSVCQAIEKLTDRIPGIKWVNDILIDGRKVCGILTESALSSGGLDFMVLGIGVNALEPTGGFPDEIKDIAGSVFSTDMGDMRPRLAAEILNCFWENYAGLAGNTFADEYRRRCIVPGRRVLVIKPEGTCEADALEVDDDCHLLVRYDDGTEDRLYSGEISIKI